MDKVREKLKNGYAIVGVVPPPFGGVSVHVSRKLDLLKNAGITATLYEQNGKSDALRRIVPLSKLGFLAFLCRFKEQVVHFHFNNLTALIVANRLLLFRPSRSYVVTIHSEKLKRWYEERGAHYRWAIKKCLTGATHLVCVNQSIADFAFQLGIASERVSVIPAFLPPIETELTADRIPQRLSEFISDKERVVGTHGWFGYFVENQHVYGFEHIARLAKEIADSGRNIALYTVISGCYDDEHRQKIRSMQQALSDTWMIVEEPFPCPPLFQQTDVFIRPTRTDGDSVSVRECLSLGVKVIASDAVKRPSGCHLYRTGDFQDLSTCFWEQIDSQVESDQANSGNVFGEDLVEVVRRVMQKN